MSSPQTKWDQRMAVSALGANDKSAAVATEALRGGGSGPYDPGMDTRVAKLEGAQDGIKQSQSILIMSVMGLGALVFALAGMMVTLQVFTFSRVDQVEAKVDALSARVDALPAKLADEFRAMRADMTAQTNAIANAITATRQQTAPVAPSPKP